MTSTLILLSISTSTCSTSISSESEVILKSTSSYSLISLFSSLISSPFITTLFMILTLLSSPAVTSHCSHSSHDFITSNLLTSLSTSSTTTPPCPSSSQSLQWISVSWSTLLLLHTLTLYTLFTLDSMLITWWLHLEDSLEFSSLSTWSTCHFTLLLSSCITFTVSCHCPVSSSCSCTAAHGFNRCTVISCCLSVYSP